MMLKERLDAVWNKNEIACPCHIVIWSEKNTGWARFAEYGLFYRRGKLLGPKKKKIKGKGWTWICRNYGVVSRMVIK